MPGSDPSFWEIPVPPEVFETREGGLVHLLAPADGRNLDRARWRQRAARELRLLVAGGLTDRQRQIVEMYFFAGRTQVEIAAELGISQQAVSRQLFGVVRRGQRVGGAIKRLRALCVEAGLDPDEWV